ncbi:MAG TPA: hypothetical protein VLI67_09605 [Vicinamibacteria bacterium]|nr:hypothetical protein [Vicinamibacteria bacterium]
MAAACGPAAEGGLRPSSTTTAPRRAAARAPAEPRPFIENAGRVDWYRGQAHELIAYDSIADEKSKDLEVYTAAADASGRRCVTCEAGAISKGFVGQPAWHPDGEHIVIQAENGNSEHRFYSHVSFGIDNDLWLIRRDGSEAQRIWTSKDKHGALHPHFSEDGRKLIFAERVPTGEKIHRLLLRRLAPGGENQWTGWRIHVADVDLSRKSEGILSNHRTMEPNGPGFYETHGFAPDGGITYSFTPGGEAYVADSYRADLDGSHVRNLTDGDAPGTWNEHAQYSPDGSRLAFISSRMDRSLRFPKSRPKDLRTELFVRLRGGPARQVTDMNGRLNGKVVVSDFDWDRRGRRIVYQVACLDGSRDPALWMIGLD